MSTLLQRQAAHCLTQGWLLLPAVFCVVINTAHAAESGSYRLYSDNPNYASEGLGEAANFALNENGLTWEQKPGVSSNYQVVTAPPKPPEPPASAPPPPVVDSGGTGGGPGSGRRPCEGGGFGCRRETVAAEEVAEAPVAEETVAEDQPVAPPEPAPPPPPPAPEPASVATPRTQTAAPVARTTRRRVKFEAPPLTLGSSDKKAFMLPQPAQLSLRFGGSLISFCPEELITHTAAPPAPAWKGEFPWLLLWLLIIALVCTYLALRLYRRWRRENNSEQPIKQNEKDQQRQREAEEREKRKARELAREKKWEQEWEQEWERKKATEKQREIRRRKQELQEMQARERQAEKAKKMEEKRLAALALQKKKEAKKKRKKKRRLHIQFAVDFVLVVLTTASLSVSAEAATTGPQTNVYNGHLLDSSGNAVTTSHTIRFSYWTTADFAASDLTSTGAINTGTGTYVGWFEEHTFTPNSDGYFSVILGSINALPDFRSMPVNTLKNLYLQEEVKMAGAADTTYELLDHDTSSPTVDRAAVLSVPTARNADLLDQRDIGTGSGSIPLLGSGGKLTLESSSASGAISLEFGAALGKKLNYDQLNEQFDFNAPLNVQGGLTVGNVDVGSGTGAGTIRWTGSDFQGYDGTNWSNLDTGGSTFVGTTTATSDGSFSTGSLVGYEAANAYCNAQFAGSHMCQVDEIITTISASLSDFTGASNGWMAEGAPGYTSHSNDCRGWTNNGVSELGAWWQFSTDGGVTIASGGGKGYLTNCAVVQPIACCR